LTTAQLLPSHLEKLIARSSYHPRYAICCAKS